MKKENIIDLISYRALRHPDVRQVKKPPVSKELETAIQLLIRQLRELGPIEQRG